MASSPKIKLIQKCAELLDVGKFTEFWVEYAANASEVFTAATFTDSVRILIAENIKVAFKTISSDKFQSMLGLTPGELITFCAASAAVEELKGDIVVMALCAENQARLKHFEESLRFDEALRLVDSIRRTQQEGVV